MTLRQLAERRPDRLRDVMVRSQMAEQGQAVLPRDLEAMLDAFLRARTVQESAPPQTTEEKLAALRGVVDAGGPQTPVRSLPRWTGPTIGGRSRRQVDDEKVLPLNDTEPLAQHGLLNALIGHGATRSNMPSLEDVGSMSPAMGVMKATQGAARTLVNGMYSRLDEAAKMLPKKGVPASGVMNWLKKSPEGINPEEAAFRKLDQWLSSQGTKTVTPEMLASHLQANPAPFPQVKTRGGVSPQSEAAQNISEQVERISPAAFDGLHETLGQTTAANARLWSWSAAEGGAFAGESIAKINALPIPQAQKEAILEYGRLAVQSRTANEAMLGSRTKFDQYQVPGGENYRETLLTLPARPKESYSSFINKMEKKYGAGYENEQLTPAEQTLQTSLWDEAQEYGHTSGRPDDAAFRSSHFPDDPNILVHTRANDRTLPSGEQGRFVEEVQSDAHQLALKKGYRSAANDEKPYVVKFGGGADGQEIGRFASEQAAQDFAVSHRRANGNENWKYFVAHEQGADAVPDLPFKDTWPDLGLKQQLIEAANDPKAEWLGFTGGKTQADRYDLSKQVDEVRIIKADNGKYGVVVFQDSGGGTSHAVANKINLDINEVESLVGKDLAKKAEAQAAGEASYTGLDLQVGGEGMTAFYDQKLPKRLEKIVKPFGGTVEPGGVTTTPRIFRRDNGWFAETPSGADGPFPTQELAVNHWQGSSPAWMSRLTPEMKDAIKRGVPLMTVLAATSGTLANMGQRTTQRGGQ